MSQAAPLDNLADSADLVFMHFSHNINMVQVPTSMESQPTNEIKAMKEMIVDLQKQLNKMKVTKHQSPMGWAPSRLQHP